MLGISHNTPSVSCLDRQTFIVQETVNIRVKILFLFIPCVFINHFVLQCFNESPDFDGTLKSAVVKQMSSVKMILKKLYPDM